MKRFLVLLLLTPLFGLLGVLFSNSSVNAVSIYDNLIKSTDEIILEIDTPANNWSPELQEQFNAGNDISMYWSNPITDPGYASWIETKRNSSYVPPINLKASLNQALDTGTVFVGFKPFEESSTGGNRHSEYYIFWINENPEIKWIEGAVYSKKTWNQLTVHNFDRKEGYGVPIGPTNEIFMDYKTTNDVRLNWYSILFFKGDLTYPVDYDGEIISENVPKEKEKLKPIYNIVIDDEGKARVKYTKNLDHFLTGTSYIVTDQLKKHWEGGILVENIVPVKTVQPSGYMDETIQLPMPVDGETDYYMMRFDYTGGLDSPPWPAGTNENYEVDQVWIQFKYDGTPVETSNKDCLVGICNEFKDEDNTTKDMFGRCFISSLPFVNIEECVNDVKTIIGMLSFGTLKFKNNWASDPQCSTLGTLASWIPVENKTICPAMPSKVRDVVTPFVTFILGLITVKFIANIGREGL